MKSPSYTTQKDWEVIIDLGVKEKHVVHAYFKRESTCPGRACSQGQVWKARHDCRSERTSHTSQAQSISHNNQETQTPRPQAFSES